ncbi:hypothetical protein BB560_002382 [Smittium megazygosporum]|uniref:YMC020W-like alpha/beta hydrolase domain-containing protein n=1 Tax=Smittium megazygosporum TaxID=133381 RepID=A0A2T9ZF09_9FUNG|nr:hypothetical protein BB560_002382 [Smittium megazygosporum]
MFFYNSLGKRRGQKSSADANKDLPTENANPSKSSGTEDKLNTTFSTESQTPTKPPNPQSNVIISNTQQKAEIPTADLPFSLSSSVPSHDKGLHNNLLLKENIPSVNQHVLISASTSPLNKKKSPISHPNLRDSSNRVAPKASILKSTKSPKEHSSMFLETPVDNNKSKNTTSSPPNPQGMLFECTSRFEEESPFNLIQKLSPLEESEGKHHKSPLKTPPGTPLESPDILSPDNVSIKSSKEKDKKSTLQSFRLWPWGGKRSPELAGLLLENSTSKSLKKNTTSEHTARALDSEAQPSPVKEYSSNTNNLEILDSHVEPLVSPTENQNSEHVSIRDSGSTTPSKNLISETENNMRFKANKADSSTPIQNNGQLIKLGPTQLIRKDHSSAQPSTRYGWLWWRNSSDLTPKLSPEQPKNNSEPSHRLSDSFQQSSSNNLDSGEISTDQLNKPEKNSSLTTAKTTETNTFSEPKDDTEGSLEIDKYNSTNNKNERSEENILVKKSTSLDETTVPKEGAIKESQNDNRTVGWGSYVYSYFASTSSKETAVSENSSGYAHSGNLVNFAKDSRDPRHQSSTKHRKSTSISSASYKITDTGIMCSINEQNTVNEEKYSVSYSKNPNVIKPASIVEPSLGFDEIYGYTNSYFEMHSQKNKSGIVDYLKRFWPLNLGNLGKKTQHHHSFADLNNIPNNSPQENFSAASHSSEETPLLTDHFVNEYKIQSIRSIHKSAASIKKIAVVGIHGWFPTKLWQMVAGAPTGTSEKFCEKMKSSILEYLKDDHDIDFNEDNIIIMPVVCQGTIEHRVEISLSQLLDIDDEEDGDSDKEYYQDNRTSLEEPLLQENGYDPRSLDSENSLKKGKGLGDIEEYSNMQTSFSVSGSDTPEASNKKSNTQKYLVKILQQDNSSNLQSPQTKENLSSTKNDKKSEDSKTPKSKSHVLPIDILVPRKKDRRKILEQADMVLVVTHSQGTPVSALILERLIELDIVKPRVQRVGMLAMAGISHGPFPVFRDNVVIKYVERDEARELFFFTDPSSLIVTQYIAALGAILQKGVRLLCVASWVDEVVPFYSAILHSISHPNIYRAVCITPPMKRNFLTDLAIFAIKLRNAGISDLGLSIHISDAIAGSIWPGSVSGHSTIYEETQVYKLMLKWLLFSSSSMPPFVPITHQNLQPTKISMNFNNNKSNPQQQNSHDLSPTNKDGVKNDLVSDNDTQTSFFCLNSSFKQKISDLFCRFSLGSCSPGLCFCGNSNLCYTLNKFVHFGSLVSSNRLDSEDTSEQSNSGYQPFSNYGATSQSPHIVYHPFNSNDQLNPFFLPWIVKSLLSSPVINSNPVLVAEMDELITRFDEWVPESKLEKELKYRLEPLKLSF